jgi:endonuclease/exonuclease/phosphatase family metal-dependent hydrolase
MEISMKKNFVNKTNIQAMLYAVLALVTGCVASGCVGCNVSGEEDKAPENSASLAIMTWNTQALFDGIDNGTEYEEYRESAGWTQDKYKGRLNVIAAAIGGLERKPDIIALQELESAQVAIDLAASLSAHGYGWTYFANIPGMALGVGVLSRYPFAQARSHSVYIDGEIAPRPMLEVKINTANAAAGKAADSLLLFVCHWKSKLGGDDATESARRASARIILRRLRELAETEPDLPVVIMGDLNENHDDFYRRGGKVISALMPDDPRAAEFSGLYGIDGEDTESAAMIEETQKDFLILVRSKPPAAKYFPSGAITLYSPWYIELKNGNDESSGSYYYKNDWETIDHFLLSPQFFNGSGWDFENARILNIPPFTSAKGIPVAYNPRTGAGLSDHLPLFLLLKKGE